MNGRNRGFGLIEVMVAIAVIGIGVTGLVVLQKTFLRSSSENMNRSVAMELAKSKLEDFRRFDDVVSGTANYVDIVSGNDTVAVGGQNYSRTWGITDLYYDKSTNSWSTVMPNGAVSSDQKLVAINVSWSNVDGTESVALNSSLSASSTAEKKQSLDPTPSSAGPQVAYTPGQAPDVIALNLNTAGQGNKRETSKPLPEVIKQGNSTLVKFDTVTYKPNSTTLIREDFATINCECSLLASTAQAYTPFRSKPDLNDDGTVNEHQVIVEDGTLLSKSSGTPSTNNASSYCTVCCANHFDAASGSYPGFDPDRTSPHSHYRFNSTSYNTFNASTFSGSNFALATSGNYLEACRLLRVDGFYRVTQDWRLIDLVMMRKDWLESAANQTAYQTYVLAKVKDFITGSSTADRNSLRDTVSPDGLLISGSGVTQLMARGIYVDYLDAQDISYLSSIINGSDSDWPSLVPFYDVNLTLLADWKIPSGSGLSVTNESIQSVDSDPSSDYYGTYSRGALTVANSSSGSVAVRARKGNTGITGSLPTDESDATQYFEDSLVVSLSGASSAVKGSLVCRVMKSSGNATTDCDNTIPEAATIVAVNSATGAADPDIQCSVVSAGGNNAKPAYSCTGFSSSWVGQLNFSYTGFTFKPTSVSVNIATQADANGIVAGGTVTMCSAQVVANNKCN